MKSNICPHCGAVDKHFGFQCYTQRKPILKKGDKINGFTVTKVEKKSSGATTATINPPSVPDLLKLAEKSFNKWIVKRDSFNGRFICIACDKEQDVKFAQCGHFYPKTFSYLRFNEDNCNAECITCNCIDLNHLIGYATNLENKIGAERFKTLELEKNAFIKWDREELLDIIKKYKL